MPFRPFVPFHQDDKFPLASKLAESAGNVVLAGVKNGPEFAYYNAWKILRCVLCLLYTSDAADE